MDKGRQRDEESVVGRDEGKTAKHATLDGYSRRSAKDRSGVRERGREPYGSEGEAKRA